MKTLICYSPIEAIRERMGSDATTEEAVRMRDALVEFGYGGSTFAGVPDGVWVALIAKVCGE